MPEKITIELELSNKFLHDVFLIVMSGAISYWVKEWTMVSTLKRQWGATIRAEGDSSGFLRGISAPVIVAGIKRSFQAPHRRYRCADAIHRAVISGSASSIDAEAADVIVQLGLFGEVRYG